MYLASIICFFFLRHHLKYCSTGANHLTHTHEAMISCRRPVYSPGNRRGNFLQPQRSLSLFISYNAKNIDDGIRKTRWSVRCNIPPLIILHHLRDLQERTWQSIVSKFLIIYLGLSIFLPNYLPWCCKIIFDLYVNNQYVILELIGE